jgi:hypothetical protein
MIVCHLSEGQGFGEVEDALNFKSTSKAVVIAVGPGLELARKEALTCSTTVTHGQVCVCTVRHNNDFMDQSLKP